MLDHPIKIAAARGWAVAGRVAVLAAVAWTLAGPTSAREAIDGELGRLAREAGCSTAPLDYVAGFWSAADASSGVFWCRRDERHAAEGRVVIVVVDRTTPRRLGCPSSVVAINEPGGLRVLREERLPLSSFVERDAPWRTGPAGVTASGPVIDTGTEGSGEQWVCHRGVWLVRVYH